MIYGGRDAHHFLVNWFAKTGPSLASLALALTQGGNILNHRFSIVKMTIFLYIYSIIHNISTMSTGWIIILYQLICRYNEGALYDLNR